MKQTIEQETVIDPSVQAKSFHPGILSITGPVSILLSILLLIVKESPYYIDLAAVGIVGLILSWRFSLGGFLLSNFILLGVIFYDVFVEEQPFGLWDAGVVTTLELAFVLTLLSGKELLDQIQALGGEKTHDIEEKERLLAGIQSEKQIVENRLKQTLALLAQKVEAKEQSERLLKMAREEMLHEIKKREEIEAQFFEQKQQVTKLQEKIEDASIHADQIQLLRQIIDQKEHELFSLKSTPQGFSLEDLNQGKVLDLEQTIERISFEKSGIESSYHLLEKNFEDLDKKYHEQAAIFHENEGKIQDLADRLEKLTDRLKEVQKEKDELEKQLDQALQPNETVEVDHKDPLFKEVKRVGGLYFQLREQFEEKKYQLDQTRYQLFHLQEQLLLETKESTIREEESLIQFTKEYKNLLNQYVSEITALEQQMSTYEDLIASLSQ